MQNIMIHHKEAANVQVLNVKVRVENEPKYKGVTSHLMIRN